MTLLFAYLCLALGVSFLCSILESVLLTIPPSFTVSYEKKYPVRGKKLRHFKTDIDRPLAAILSLNTIAHTVGAAGVGAQAMVVFGSEYLAVVSAVLTLLILFLSEIIPKTIGAIYWRQLTGFTISVLTKMIILLYPLVWLSEKIILVIARKKTMRSITRDEIQALADLGLAEGLFVKKESRILKSLMHFGKMRAMDIMTPRKLIFALPETLSCGEVMKNYSDVSVSRIPLYQKNIMTIHKYILKNDLLLALAKDEMDRPVSSFSRSILVVPEFLDLFSLFEQLLNRREHIALAVNEYGETTGLVTMEDILETLLGTEIVDETDIITDMQAQARKQWADRARTRGLVGRRKKSK
jgi:CBS domain containing-hemolysin-like protein